MGSWGIALAAFVSVGVAAALALALARVGRRHRRALDDTWHEPQKLHRGAVPRIGGIAIAAGLLAGAATLTLAPEADAGLFWVLLLCLVPGFAWGLHEDLSKRGAVLARLALTGMTPVLAYVLLDARLTEVALPLLDDLLAIHALSFLFTVFAVTGIAHAINVVDGLNGLAGMTALLAAAGIALVAWTVGDAELAGAAAVLGATVAGFLLVNYPRGRLFLGDGGAYLVGLMLALLAVMLVHRNPEVSPWFPLVLLAYPVWETLFSAWRRRRRGRSPGHADALHLHSLVYRRMVRRTDAVARNSLASLIMWFWPFLCLALALVLWRETLDLQLAALSVAALYVLAYRRLVRFGVPRRRAAAAPVLEADPAAEGR